MPKAVSQAVDYMMSHRPLRDMELSQGLHDLENVFPGIYGKYSGSYKTYQSPKIDAEALKAIYAAKDNPDAMIDIYRAVPKGVRDINTGDWVSISKGYAKGHGESVLGGNYDLLKAKAKASDLSNPGDSIAEEGYWGESLKAKVTRAILAAMMGGGAAELGGAGDAQAAMQSRWDAYGENPEKPLEEPAWSPVDAVTAPIGVAGVGAKALAMALDPAIGVAMDALVKNSMSDDDDKQRVARILDMFSGAGTY